MKTVTETIQQGAETAENRAKELAEGAEGSGHDLVSFLGKVARQFMSGVGLDAKTPARLFHRLGLESRRDSRTAEIGAFAMGLMVGGGAALIFAPMSGDQLRKRVREGIVGLLAAGDEKVEHAKAEAKSIVETVVHSAEGVADHLKHSVDGVAATTDRAKDGAKTVGHA